MKETIIKLAESLQNELVTTRRDLHRHAEAAWTEFRTASIVAERLESYGYKVLVGEEIVDERSMMGVPSKEELAKHMERAKTQGAPLKYLQKMAGGKTGVAGILDTGKPGPVVALRFDMDCNDLHESTSSEHRPAQEGFASINPGAMHACGHDGHTSIGLGVAKVLATIQGELSGVIKLIFQPGEEGVRGAASMVSKGIVDDVDYLIGGHLGFQADRNGDIICGIGGFLATSKFDAVFKGLAAHAGARPEEGKSALLAAAAATLALQGIYRHSAGASRINIGVLQAGTGRNVVPDSALMKIETRGATSEIDAFIKKEAVRMIKASAAMYDVEVAIQDSGGAMSGESDPEIISVTKETAQALGIFDNIIDRKTLGGSEDFSYFMDRVQKRGGKAGYLMLGAGIAAGHHDACFDFDETVLSKGVALFSSMVYRLGKQGPS